MTFNVNQGQTSTPNTPVKVSVPPPPYLRDDVCPVTLAAELVTTTAAAAVIENCGNVDANCNNSALQPEDDDDAEYPKRMRTSDELADNNAEPCDGGDGVGGVVSPASLELARRAVSQYASLVQGAERERALSQSRACTSRASWQQRLTIDARSSSFDYGDLATTTAQQPRHSKRHSYHDDSSPRRQLQQTNSVTSLCALNTSLDTATLSYAFDRGKRRNVPLTNHGGKYSLAACGNRLKASSSGEQLVVQAAHADEGVIASRLNTTVRTESPSRPHDDATTTRDGVGMHEAPLTMPDDDDDQFSSAPIIVTARDRQHNATAAAAAGTHHVTTKPAVAEFGWCAPANDGVAVPAKPALMIENGMTSSSSSSLSARQRATSIVSSTSTDNGLGMDADNNDCRTDRPRLSGDFMSDVTRAAAATSSDVSATVRPLSTLSTTSVDTGIYSEPGDCAANRAATVGGDVNDVSTAHHGHQHHDVTTADGEFSSEQHF